MSKLYYCTDCKRIFTSESTCQYCNSTHIRELAVGTPVSVIGNKLKGNVLRIMENEVRLVVRDQSNVKMLKEFEPEKLKKVL